MSGQTPRLGDGETRPIDALQPMTLTRRRWLAAAAAAAGGVALGRVPALARQGTPEATARPASRDWRGQHWVGSWARGMHAPSPAI